MSISCKGRLYDSVDGEKVLKAYRYRTDRLLKDDVKDTMPQDTLRLWKHK